MEQKVQNCVSNIISVVYKKSGILLVNFQLCQESAFICRFCKNGKKKEKFLSDASSVKKKRWLKSELPKKHWLLNTSWGASTSSACKNIASQSPEQKILCSKYDIKPNRKKKIIIQQKIRDGRIPWLPCNRDFMCSRTKKKCSDPWKKEGGKKRKEKLQGASKGLSRYY